MRLGVAIILIGLVWCVRSYLLRPRPLVTDVPAEVFLPAVNRDLDYMPLPAGCKVGETVSYVYWNVASSPQPVTIDRVTFIGGGSKMSKATRAYECVEAGNWVETGRSPR